MENQTLSSLHPVVISLLKKKGMQGNEIADFLSWDLKALPDLTKLHDLNKASERIIKAHETGEKIGIYGDYDVDGTTSCALLHYFFKMIDTEVQIYQPSRFVEGYGIHPAAIETAIEDGIKVLITVDCGITNNETADYAKERGIDLIITDHHTDTKEEMPNAFAVVNPCRRDEEENSPLRPLAGVGVAFALSLQLKNDLEASGKTVPSIYPLLQFVAVGTVCDLAPLTPMNLKMVRHGLKQIPTSSYPGLLSFFPPEERNEYGVTSEKLSFLVGPMINSKGRLDHPDKALKLLLSETREEAFEYFTLLEISNNERKFIQSEVYKGAKEEVLKDIDPSDHLASIVYKPDWHEGVIGIVASKLVDTFKAPAIIFTNSSDENIIKASARTAGELNLFECLNACNHLYTKFGGHKAAAGLSMPKENFPKFKEEMKRILKDIPAISRTKLDTYDLEIKFEDITPKLLKDLRLLEPHGQENKKPVFLLRGIKIDSYDILKDIHVRWNFSKSDEPNKKLRGITFGYLNKWNIKHPTDLFRLQNENNEGLSILFTLGINRFNGNEYIQLNVEKIDVGSIV